MSNQHSTTFEDALARLADGLEARQAISRTYLKRGMLEWLLKMWRDVLKKV